MLRAPGSTRLQHSYLAGGRQQTGINISSSSGILGDTWSVSRRNVELIKELQPTGVDMVELVSGDAFDSPPFDAADDLFDTEFEVSFIAPDHSSMEYRGHEGFVAGWREWLTAWASYRIEAEEFFDAGDDVVVFIHVEARTARDGVVMEHSPAGVWSLRDGKVVGLRMYLDREDAMTAVGLAEQERQRT
jgi:ketosteroid isomerase-like protein